MTSLLVLLGLLSVATLLSRRGYFAFVTHIVTAPILLAFGVLLSPRGLAFVTPSTLEALLPALRVGIAWLAVLVGLRAGSRRGEPPASPRDVGHALLAGAGGFVACAAVALLSLLASRSAGVDLVGAYDVGPPLLGAAILLGGVLSPSNPALVREALQGRAPVKVSSRLLVLSRHEEVVGGAAILLAIWLLPVPVGGGPAAFPSAAAAGLAAALGVVLAVAQLQAGGRGKDDEAVTRRIALMGLVTLTAGLAARTHIPEAAVAFVMGMVLARTEQGALLLEALAATERPVRIVVITLLGANLGLTWAAATAGLLIALTRLAVKGAAALAWGGRSAGATKFSAAAGAPSSALLFAGSVALALDEGLLRSGLLATTAVAVAASDLATLLARAWVRMRRGSAAEEEEGVLLDVPLEGRS